MSNSYWPEIDLIGWLLLVTVALAAALMFGMVVSYYGVDHLLGELRNTPARHSGIQSLASVMEVLLIPLSAFVAGGTRLGSDWIQGVRDGRLGPWLPLLLAASIVGLATYVWWTLVSLQPGSGADEFGPARWLGAALAVAFPFVWLPLFPRLTWMLAGMIAGPAVVALAGYTFFGAVFVESGSQLCSHESCGVSALIVSLFGGQLGLFVLFRNKLSLLWAASVGVTTLIMVATGKGDIGLVWVALLAGWVLVLIVVGLASVARVQIRAKPTSCFVVCALVAGGLAVSGARF
ncbi:MAG: hypothetical protein F4Y63_07120 [Chloroflexi bacterium]|nr:hypothetical protein [Chloroflexota bacterium]